MPELIQQRSADQEVSVLGATTSEQTTESKVRPWAVVHACDFARQVADVVDAQIYVGMRPYLLTLHSPRLATTAGTLPQKNNSPVSLLQGWQDVRQWRKQFDENGTSQNAQLIHTHSFAAGMAAVRSDDAVVYDLRKWIEEQSSGNGSWLTRSFKTAEQFALARSSAVVVHSRTMKSECISRGVAPEDVFVVPDPMPSFVSDAGEKVAYGGDSTGLHGTVSIAVKLTRPVSTDGEVSSDNKRSDLTLETLLLAFSQLLQEIDTTRLVVITPSDLLLSVSQKARSMEVRDKVLLVPEEEDDKALAIAEVVIADPIVMEAGRSQEGVESLAVSAMAQGKAVLAADNQTNREVSPDGRGLLWYSAEPSTVVREMVHRLAFMTRNADFRRALGEAGHQHLLQTRSPQRLGRLYDEVYRHAFSRKHKGKSSQNLSGSLVPMQAGV